MGDVAHHVIEVEGRDVLLQVSDGRNWQQRPILRRNRVAAIRIAVIERRIAAGVTGEPNMILDDPLEAFERFEADQRVAAASVEGGVHRRRQGGIGTDRHIVRVAVWTVQVLSRAARHGAVRVTGRKLGRADVGIERAEGDMAEVRSVVALRRSWLLIRGIRIAADQNQVSVLVKHGNRRIRAHQTIGISNVEDR